MTEDQQQAAAPPPRRGWGAGRVLLLLVSLFAVLIALALLAGGGALLWLDQTKRDDDGYLTSPTERFATGAFALATNGLDVTTSSGPDFATDPERFGKIKIEASGAGGRPVFVGVGPEASVDSYLRGVAHDRIADIDFHPFTVDYQRRPGGPPRADPATQTFWVAQASGEVDETLRWTVQSGHWSVVVMNADASRGVEVEVAVGARLGFLLWVAVGLLAAGALVGVGSGFLLYLTFRSA